MERVPADTGWWRRGLACALHLSSDFVDGQFSARLIPGIAGLIFMLCATSFTLF